MEWGTKQGGGSLEQSSEGPAAPRAQPDRQGDGDGTRGAERLAAAVRAKLAVGDVVAATRGVRVNVSVIDERGVVLWVRGERPERLSWDCLDRIAERLRNGDVMPRCAQRVSLAWVRALFDAAGVETDAAPARSAATGATERRPPR